MYNKCDKRFIELDYIWKYFWIKDDCLDQFGAIHI